MLGIDRRENPNNPIYLELRKGIIPRETTRYQIVMGKFKQKNGSKSKWDYSKYLPFLYTSFNVSEQCCDIMKKSPVHKYQEKTGKVGITAQMACESRMRLQKWLQNGCNSFDNKFPVSNPMSFWTEQDILLYIKQHEEEMVQWSIENIEKIYGCPLEEIINTETCEPAFPRDTITPICSVYGEIVPNDDQYTLAPECELKTTGCQRTGCIFCGFGCHLEKGETRFQRLKRTHPTQYNFCMNGGEYDENGVWKPNKDGLGMAHVFDEINKIYGEGFIRYK